MRYLYKHYNKEYNDFCKDFDRFSFSLRGKPFNQLEEEDLQDDEVKEMVEYYNKKNPLLETNGVMNNVCDYMVKSTKGIGRKSNLLDSEETFELLFNYSIIVDNDKLALLRDKKKEYDDFKKTKQLAESEFADYQQYFKHLRNECFRTISSNIQELANLAVMICYKENAKKDKNFCWDLFGAGIVENLKETHKVVHIPVEKVDGQERYLGKNYEICEFDLEELEKKESEGDNWWQETLDLFNMDDMDIDDE